MAKFYYKDENYLLEQAGKYRRGTFSYLGKAFGVFLLWVVFTFLTFSLDLGFAFRLFVFVLGSVGLFVWVAIYLYGYSKHESKWFRYESGITGESKVHRELEKLSDEYSVFCDAKLKYGNLDFGVLKGDVFFNIEVKNHKGEIELSGNRLLRNGRFFRETDPIKEVLRNEEYLKERFFNTRSVGQIVSLVVFANPNTFVKAFKVDKNLFVLHNRGLVKFIDEYYS